MIVALLVFEKPQFKKQGCRCDKNYPYEPKMPVQCVGLDNIPGTNDLIANHKLLVTVSFDPHLPTYLPVWLHQCTGASNISYKDGIAQKDSTFTGFLFEGT